MLPFLYSVWTCTLLLSLYFSVSLTLQFTNASFTIISVAQQIHKQAPPLEDIAEDCSLSMRSFLKRALERNPALRSSASELLKDEAINPPKEDQPRCWSLDSALEEVTHTMLRLQNHHLDTTQGKDQDIICSDIFSKIFLSLQTCSPSFFCRIFSLL